MVLTEYGPEKADRMRKRRNHRGQQLYDIDNKQSPPD